MASVLSRTLPDPARLGAVFDAVRASTVRVHCITSMVAGERTANTLLAIGVRPSLTVNPDEIRSFVTSADSLLINLGMSDPIREAAIPLAIEEARASRKPWVLDPAFANISELRRRLAATCLSQMPNIVKANRSEAFLIDTAPSNTMRVVTGNIDVITGSGNNIEIANGHPMASRVTATGCALGAVLAACLAVEPDACLAAAAGLVAYGIAAEQAAENAAGPGSFGVALIDALAAMDGKTIARYAKIS